MSYRLKSLISNLIIKAIVSDNDRKPGKLIKGLPKKDRELLKTAKSSDFYHRIKYE